MRTIFERRASTILFNLLQSLQYEGIFLIPANVCPIVPVTFLKAKRRYELVDISTQTLCMDEQVLIRKLKKAPQQYSGVLFVHTFGVQRSFERLFKAIKEVARHALLIDNRCLCVPDFSTKRKTSADAVLYSTGYSKYVDMGYGGFAFVKPTVAYASRRLAYNKAAHESLVAAMRKVQMSNQAFSYHDTDWLDTSTPTISIARYRADITAKLPRIHVHKKILNRIYSDLIPKKNRLERHYQSWRFNVLVSHKDELIKEIFKQGLFASSHFPSLRGVFGQGSDHNAANLHSRVVNLFNNERFSPEQAEQTAAIVSRHIKRFAN